MEKFTKKKQGAKKTLSIYFTEFEIQEFTAAGNLCDFQMFSPSVVMLAKTGARIVFKEKKVNSEL